MPRIPWPHLIRSLITGPIKANSFVQKETIGRLKSVRYAEIISGMSSDAGPISQRLATWSELLTDEFACGVYAPLDERHRYFLGALAVALVEAAADAQYVERMLQEDTA